MKFSVRSVVCVALAVLVVMSAAAPAYAGCFGRRAARRAARAYVAPCAVATCQTTYFQAATVTYTATPTVLAVPQAPVTVPANPQVPAKVQPAPQAPQLTPAPVGYYGAAGDALALINAARMARGLQALPFSSTLAAYAASNNAVHAAGSSGGAGQCWAGVTDPVSAARMWLVSPPHLAILMNATTAIGIANCPSGVTANAY